MNAGGGPDIWTLLLWGGAGYLVLAYFESWWPFSSTVTSAAATTTTTPATTTTTTPATLTSTPATVATSSGVQNAPGQTSVFPMNFGRSGGGWSRRGGGGFNPGGVMQPSSSTPAVGVLQSNSAAQAPATPPVATIAAFPTPTASGYTCPPGSPFAGAVVGYSTQCGTQAQASQDVILPI